MSVDSLSTVRAALEIILEERRRTLAERDAFEEFAAAVTSLDLDHRRISIVVSDGELRGPTQSVLSAFRGSSRRRDRTTLAEVTNDRIYVQDHWSTLEFG